MSCEQIYVTWHLDGTDETKKPEKTELLPQKPRLKYKHNFSWNSNNETVEMGTKVKTTANLYDLNFLINISMQYRRFGQQVGKIPNSQFGRHPFKYLFQDLHSKRKIWTKTTKLSWTRILNIRMTHRVWRSE